VAADAGQAAGCQVGRLPPSASRSDEGTRIPNSHRRRYCKATQPAITPPRSFTTSQSSGLLVGSSLSQSLDLHLRCPIRLDVSMAEQNWL
jgi:hypothetical protein